jgi:3-dehydroquinate synthase II
MSAAKKVWVRVEPWDVELAGLAIEAGADALFVSGDDVAKARALGVIEIVAPGGDLEPGRDLVELTVSGEKDEPAVVAAAREKRVLVRTTDWEVIPLENLVAQLQGSGHLFMEAKDLEQAKTYLGVLEVGVDGLLVDSRDAGVVRAIVDEVKGEAGNVALERAGVTGVRQLGMGDRVCVDSCTMMARGEGMLIGSSSAVMFLVHAETSENPYVAPRPFRVNAGPVHAYIRAPGDRTRYLSELRSGDEILIAAAGGRVQAAVVGRVKRERRPLLLVEAEVEADGQKTPCSVILQNAETVRLTSPEGEPLSVVALKTGDEVLVALDKAGRHFGHRIDETIEES